MKIKLPPWDGEPVETQHPWPDDTTLIQGGQKGVVMSRSGNYRTAYVEIFGPRTGFIRGEGETLALAEDACWAKAQHVLGCTRHEYESRGYKNGGGFCKNCGHFGDDAFTPEQLGVFCAACGVPTFWHSDDHETVGEFFVCPTHVPHRDGWCPCQNCLANHKAGLGELTEEDIHDGLDTLFGEIAPAEPEQEGTSP